MRTSFPAAIAVALLAPGIAGAQVNDAALPKAADPDPPAAQAAIDTTIPENPGFAVIALTPTNVIDPSSMRVSSFNISDFIDDDGKAKTGLAFAFSPYFWANRHERLSTYQKKVASDWLTRALSLTTVSVGYVRKEDGKPERLGFGFATELLGKTGGPDGKPVFADFRLDTTLSDCLGAAYTQYRMPDAARIRAEAQQALAASKPPTNTPLPPIDKANPFPPGSSASESFWLQQRQSEEFARERERIIATEIPVAMKTEVARCRKVALDDHANRQSLVLAGGVALLPNPRPREDNTNGGSVWLSYRRPLGIVPGNYLTAFGRWDFDRQAEIPAGFQDFEKLSAALLIGYDRKLPEEVERGLARVSLQGGYERLNYRVGGPLKDDESAYYALTVDFRILKNTYLEVKGGQGSLEIGSAGKKADKVTFSIRHSLQ